MKKKLAIFSVSAGAGHTRAAEAVRATAALNHPDWEVTHIDVMSLVGDVFKKLYADSYLSLVENHPGAWGYLYKKTDRKKVGSKLHGLRQTIERLNTRQFREQLEQLQPDIILNTHFLPAEILSRLRLEGRYRRPVYVQVTDFDIHEMWLQEDVTGYFVATEEVKFRLRERGAISEMIHVTGIPIMPAFRAELQRSQCAAELGLDPTRKTFLLMSGGFGVGDLPVLAERLLAIGGDFQLVALAGRNTDMLAKLQRLAVRFPGRLFPQGFTTTIERIMKSSDLAITKPGGLTTSECLAMGLPMLIISPIPGQEERNADFLLEEGAALKAIDGTACEYRLRRVLADPNILDGLRRNALRIAAPTAADRVLSVMLGS